MKQLVETETRKLTDSNDGEALAIHARGLTKYYAHRSVLRQIDLEIPTAQSVMIRGANGAGKTTLLRCLASSVRPDSGEIWWFGQPIQGRPRLRHLIGVLAHESRLYPQLNLRENLLFAARMYGLDQPRHRVSQYLSVTGMSAHGQKMPSQVSRGMRQRIAVARVLIHEPPILLMDEPTSGLDQDGRQWLWQQIGQLREQGRTIVMVTHDDNFAGMVADRVIRLHSGRIMEDKLADARQAA